MAFDFLWARLSVWLMLIVACVFAGVGSVMMAKAYVAGALLIAAAFGLMFLLNSALRAQQNEIARFIDAVRFSDLSQSFSNRSVTRKLAASLNSALGRLRETTSARDADAVLLRALYEHAPVAVMAIGSRGEMRMMNLAARRLFGAPAADQSAALARLSPELAQALSPAAKAGRALVRTRIDGRTVRLVVTSETVLSRGASIRIASVQNIDSELGAAEFDAWRDLVRVLTHEIMNTMTPVASLSQLIRQLSQDLVDADPASGRAQTAGREIGECAETLSVRAQSLLVFIGAYRELTRLPPPDPTEIDIASLLARLKTLFEGAGGPDLALNVEPRLKVVADAGQIEQALINLIANAREAHLSAGTAQDIEIAAGIDGSGAVAITIADHGSGIADDVKDRMFTPFYSTKPGGGGVGLSLVRQIALAHGGSIDYSPRSGSGARFVLRLPAK